MKLKNIPILKVELTSLIRTKEKELYNFFYDLNEKVIRLIRKINMSEIWRIIRDISKLFESN